VRRREDEIVGADDGQPVEAEAGHLGADLLAQPPPGLAGQRAAVLDQVLEQVADHRVIATGQGGGGGLELGLEPLELGLGRALGRPAGALVLVAIAARHHRAGHDRGDRDRHQRGQAEPQHEAGAQPH
jgi:hypothetical protein